MSTLATAEFRSGDGSWRTEDAWPPADATLHRFPVRPGSYQDTNTNSVRTASAGLWTFTEPAPYDLRFAGPYEVAVQVAGTVSNPLAIVTAANPGFGISPSVRYLEEQATEAQNSPANLATFLQAFRLRRALRLLSHSVRTLAMRAVLCLTSRQVM